MPHDRRERVVGSWTAQPHSRRPVGSWQRPGPGDQEGVAPVVARQTVIAERRVRCERLDPAEPRAVLEHDLARLRQWLSGPRDHDTAGVRRLLVGPEAHRRQHGLTDLGRDRAALAVGVDERVRDEVRGAHPSATRRTRGSRRRQTTERSATRYVEPPSCSPWAAVKLACTVSKTTSQRRDGA